MFRSELPKIILNLDGSVTIQFKSISVLHRKKIILKEFPSVVLTLCGLHSVLIQRKVCPRLHVHSVTSEYKHSSLFTKVEGVF